MQGAIRYKVTVTAVVERTRVVGKEWGVIGQEIKDGQKVDLRGYTPEIEKTVREEVQIFEQVTDQPISLQALVAVVNNLPDPRPTPRTT